MVLRKPAGLLMASSDSTGWWTFPPEGPVTVHGVSGEQVAYAGKPELRITVTVY